MICFMKVDDYSMNPLVNLSYVIHCPEILERVFLDILYGVPSSIKYVPI